MYTVNDLYKVHGKNLGLFLVAGKAGLKRKIRKPEVHRPGLSLTGFLKSFKSFRILIFGKGEIEYLRGLDSSVRLERLKRILTHTTPAVIVARKYTTPKELKMLCEQKKIPLFRASMPTMGLISYMILLLNDEFAPTTTLHGTLVEVFGVGVLIQGESAVGKSEAALGLLERGHRLISDDIVKVKKKEGNYLIGSGPELTRHLMEIRGIGLINVAHLHGAVSVREDKVLDLVIKIEQWNDNHFYDRVGLEEKYKDILGVNIPYHILPIKPGRDVILLIETITLNHRLKTSGYNTAKDFNVKLLKAMVSKKNKRQVYESSNNS
ncbi:MAG: HPr kinase/phosphorylase [Candidatus Anoxychlamydiales bacterium]|nr:HPr kinase/phosphorylase [Candidatus Anoxychlamydiales bacterium]